MKRLEKYISRGLWHKQEGGNVIIAVQNGDHYTVKVYYRGNIVREAQWKSLDALYRDLLNFQPDLRRWKVCADDHA